MNFIMVICYCVLISNCVHIYIIYQFWISSYSNAWHFRQSEKMCESSSRSKLNRGGSSNRHVPYWSWGEMYAIYSSNLQQRPFWFDTMTAVLITMQSVITYVQHIPSHCMLTDFHYYWSTQYIFRLNGITYNNLCTKQECVTFHNWHVWM